MTGGAGPGANGSEDALSARDLRNSDANIRNSVSGVKDPTELGTYNILSGESIGRVVQLRCRSLEGLGQMCYRDHSSQHVYYGVG
jgi:hypothetical protein